MTCHKSRATIALAARSGAILLFGLASFPAHGADASRWDEGTYSAVRLIAGKSVDASGSIVMRAGIEIRLSRGWKTYWRYPGDAGVPPRISFERSENVQAAAVKWPAPRRWVDAGSTSIGYPQTVILPVHVTPRDRSKPVTLRLDMDYAVCEKLCVPAEAKVELPLSGTTSAEEPRLATAEARVPKPVGVGANAGLAIVSVKRETAQPHDRIVVDVRTSVEGGPVDLFAEGPTSEWALPLPEPDTGATPGLRRFSFALDGLPPGIRPEGAHLRLTAVAPDAAIEVSYRLD